MEGLEVIEALEHGLNQIETFLDTMTLADLIKGSSFEDFNLIAKKAAEATGV